MMRFRRNFPYFLYYLTLMVNFSGELTEDGFRDVQFIDDSTTSVQQEHEKEIVLWQELKRDVQNLQKWRQKDAKLLAQLQKENSNLKLALKKLQDQRHTEDDSDKKSVVVPPSSDATPSDKILARMSRELENLAGNLNNCTKNMENGSKNSRFRRQNDERHLYNDVEMLKQEISAIKLLEDEQFTALSANVSELNKVIDNLHIQKSTPLNFVNIDQFIVPYDAHTEFERLNIRISQIGAFSQNLQEKVFNIDDKYKWYSFLVEHFNTELHVVKKELYKMMKLFYKIEIPEDEIIPSSGDSSEERNIYNSHIIYEGVNNVDDGSGIDPGIFSGSKVNENFKSDLDKAIMTANDAYAQVTQIMGRMNALEMQQNLLEKSVARIPIAQSVTMATNETGNFSQFRREIDFFIATTSNTLMDHRIMIQQLSVSSVSDHMECKKAIAISEVVREHQVDHFSAIQDMRQQFNVIDTSLNTLSLKLATMQSDLLNATLTTYKDANKELQQDLQLSKLSSNLDGLTKRFNENQDSLKSVFASLKQKTDKSEFKLVSDDLEKNNEKLQLIVSVGENVVRISDSVDRLESQLPNDCSMRSVTSKAGVYQSGVYLIKPQGFIRSFHVACDMESDAGYWTFIHRRFEGRTSFNRTFSEYEYGFGDPESDYWLGLSAIQTLTQYEDYELRVDAWDIFGDYYYAIYDLFKVTSPDYTLHLSFLGGTLSDSLHYHSGMRFSAIDRDLDASSTHCAKFYECGWWFSHCHKANLNGNFELGMIWLNNKTQDWIQFKKSSMKIRPKKFMRH